MKILPILTVIILFACSGDAVNPNQALLENYPQNWVLTVDESSDFYAYIMTNTSNTFRAHVPKTYSIITLAEEEDCNFHIRQSKTEDGRDCFTIQLENNKHIWLYPFQSPNHQEYYLGAGYRSDEINAPDDDNYKFLIHRMDDVDGVKTVTIECVALPGWYVTDIPPGFEWAQNQVTLQEYDKDDQATHWQCR